jgi:hypothetical protein
VFLSKRTAGTGKREFILGMVIQFQRAQFYLHEGKKELLITGNQMRFFFFFPDLECYNSGSSITQLGGRIEVITAGCDCDG